MGRQWQKRRRLVARADGQRRWDRAFQALLQWSAPEPSPMKAPGAPIQEVDDESSGICACLDPAAQAQTQTIEEQLERLKAYSEAQGWTLPEDHVFRD